MHGHSREERRSNSPQYTVHPIRQPPASKGNDALYQFEVRTAIVANLRVSFQG